jgi:aspartate racemase
MGIESKTQTLSGSKRRLLEELLRGKTRRAHSGSTVTRRSDLEPAPLSLMQEQLWLLETSTPSIPALYNESIRLRMKGPLEIAVLEHSLAEVIRRHEIWRTTYDTLGTRPIQRVHPAPDRFPLAFVDLRHLPPCEQEAAVLQLGKDQSRQRFDFQNGPLLRAVVVGLTDSENWLVMTAHQSIIDGISVYQIFPAELSALYGALSTGRPSPLPELPLQFSDFACWQRTWLSYWRRKLSGEIPVLRWPNIKSRPPRQTFRGHIRSFLFPQEVTAGIRRVAKRGGRTIFSVLLATFYTLLHQYTGQSDLIVGTLSPAGRKRSEVERLLGYFLNPVPLRVDISDDPPFAELVRRVQEIASEAISNDDVPFEQVVEIINPAADPTRNPYFSVGISLQPPMPTLASPWSITSMDAESGGAKLDLYIAFIDRPEGLHARVQFNPDIFEVESMTQMVKDFRVLLETIALYPERRASELVV